MHFKFRQGFLPKLFVFLSSLNFFLWAGIFFAYFKLHYFNHIFTLTNCNSIYFVVNLQKNRTYCGNDSYCSNHIYLHVVTFKPYLHSTTCNAAAQRITVGCCCSVGKLVAVKFGAEKWAAGKSWQLSFLHLRWLLFVVYACIMQEGRFLCCSSIDRVKMFVGIETQVSFVIRWFFMKFKCCATWDIMMNCVPTATQFLWPRPRSSCGHALIRATLYSPTFITLLAQILSQLCRRFAYRALVLRTMWFFLMFF